MTPFEKQQAEVKELRERLKALRAQRADLERQVDEARRAGHDAEDLDDALYRLGSQIEMTEFTLISKQSEMPSVRAY